MQAKLNLRPVSYFAPAIFAALVLCFTAFYSTAHAAKSDKTAKKSPNKVQVASSVAKDKKAAKSDKKQKSSKVDAGKSKTKAVVAKKAARKTTVADKKSKRSKNQASVKTNNQSVKSAKSARAVPVATRNLAKRAFVAASSNGVSSNLVRKNVVRNDVTEDDLRFSPVSYAPPKAASRQALRSADSVLGLRAAAAYVVDQDTGEVLINKNATQAMPIASITKLMTALVIREAGQPLDEYINLTWDDAVSLRGTRSRLRVGDILSRGDLMHIMLMSSENMAAHALARNYPGGFDAFLSAMRTKAATLGMYESDFEDASGLSHLNRSSAKDLATMMRFAYVDPVIRLYTTSPSKQIFTGSRLLEYSNTNALVRSSSWEIGLQKTGYISAAGSCLVMQAMVGGRKVLMVFLDAPNKHVRISNAEKVLEWVANGMPQEQENFDIPLASKQSDWLGSSN